MGIFKAATGALGGTLADQWLEMFYCDSMPQDVLAQRGVKRVSASTANTKGDENVISDGSLITVNEGQCALVVELGKVLAVYTEAGENTFHSKKSGSLFSGGGLGGVGRQISERISFGGDVAIHQFVMYLDMKEHHGNPFSVAVPLSVSDPRTGLDYCATVNMNGVFSYRITDPAVFYKNICGNRTGTVYKSEVQPQLEAELKSAAAVALNRLCGGGVRPTELSGSTDAITQAIQETMTEQWARLRGFTVTAVAIGAVALRPEDLAVLQSAQRAEMLTDPSMAAATLITAQADATTAAAQNQSGAGIYGIAAVQSTTAQSVKPTNIFLQKDTTGPSLWRCPCGSMNTGNFCENCGTRRPN
ncbi:MAG: SPFH domain-containing protein [Eubacterium sp.]|nr:SPFH domain-containing protein [Eubacterium sp.]